MSWWWYVEGKACEHCGRRDSGRADRNVTYNLSGMLQLALGVAVRDLSGKPMSDVASLARTGLELMRTDPTKYRELEPPNKWGTYESAMKDLEWLVEHDEPDMYLRIS